jgi:ABC-type branched-subunit amino acid transport system ATPase component/branched-subunit amino acid ABC-type transport system permease component
MTDILRFGILGLGAGALYALAAIGLVLVFRGSRVVNFAQGAVGMVAAYVFYEIHTVSGLSVWISIPAGLLASGALGALFNFLVIRQMREASALAKIVATLALLVTIQEIIALLFGPTPRIVDSSLPTNSVKIFGILVGEDRLWIFGIVIVLTVVLWAIYKFTKFGVETSAVAENPRAASALAISPNVIATINWAVGAALGGLAAILLVPITSLSADNLSLIVVPILAAAVVGKFQSFPITTLAGLAIGIAQSEVTFYVSTPGWSTAIPFIFVTIILLFRGRSIAGKDDFVGRVPAIGTGRISPGLILVGSVAVLLCTWIFFPFAWVGALQMQMSFIIILMSFVVVTGFAGQVSLAQLGFAGVGAVIAGYLYSVHGWPFELAIIVGVIAVVPIGIIVGLAGVRTRGVALAIVTLGLAYSLEAIVFDSPTYTGGTEGFVASNTHFFGINVSGLTYPDRYTTLTLVFLVIVGIGIANLRRGRAGRRLIAVRTNERAAAAMGISVPEAKMYAFVLGGMIAALGGIILTFASPVLGFTTFAGFNSITALQFSVFGGVGTLGGPLVGSGFQANTLGQQIFSFLGGDVAFALALAASVGLLALIMFFPDGLAWLTARMNSNWLTWIRQRVPSRPKPDHMKAAGKTLVVVEPKALEVSGVSVRFGGTLALSDLTLSVQPGEVVGMIGPNGAGKTTALDAITGFVTASAGAVKLGGIDISGWNPERRARAGLGRSFQSLELFDDLTVFENLQTACDSRDRLAYLTDLFKPGGTFNARARTAVLDFGLEPLLDTQARHLSFAQRRLLGVARAVAGDVSVLLLDEPASGLSEVESSALSATIRHLAVAAGIGVLLIEHNVDMVLQTCDRIYALDFGSTIGEGTPEAIRNNPAVVEAYLGTKRFHRHETETNERNEAGNQLVEEKAGSDTSAS